MKRRVESEGQMPRPVSRTIPMRPDHAERPLLLAPDRKVFLYTESRLYRVAYQFLVCIAEPIFRPVFVQEYKITKYSLHSALVLNFSTEDIVRVLGRLMKNREVPPSVLAFIQDNTRHHGGARLSLHGDKYVLLLDPGLSKMLSQANPEVFELMTCQGAVEYRQEGSALAIVKELEDEPAVGQVRQMLKYSIGSDYFEMARSLVELNITIIQEYDFENDPCPKLQFNLKPNTILRNYQQRALRNIFIDGKARSGLVILPCGAGKTLVAVTAIERIKKKALVICDGDVSVEQWRDQFLKWTTLDSRKIIRITGKVKDKIDDIKAPFVAVTTYSMVTKNREAEKVPSLITLLQREDWGACIADEVHKLPAETFQNVLRNFRFNVKLGFTATPYREDGRIDKLYYMIGPKLYEENWLDLVNEGALAKPYCVEVRCAMTEIFKQEYEELGRQELLHTANPNKFRALKYLLKVHEKRGDKVLVFCDRPKILEYLAGLMQRPFIHGEVKHELRRDILAAFRREVNDFQTLFISRVGDVAIDLPSASVAIQIGYHFGSRRQEIQRLGRIMRPKDIRTGSYSAFFYSLVSVGTEEEAYAAQRRSCLVNLGLDFQVITEESLQPMEAGMSRKEQLEYLSYVLAHHREGDKFLGSTRVVSRGLQDHVEGVYQECQFT